MNVIDIWHKLRTPRSTQYSARNIRRLLQELERYDRIFKGSHGYGFLDWDIEAKHMFWDGGFWQFIGYTDADMKRISNPDTFMEFVHPEDRESLRRAIERHIKMNGPGEASFRIRRKVGGFVHAEVRVIAIRDDNNRVVYTSGLVFDITKLKQIEEALVVSEGRHSRILQASNDGVWEWSADHGGFHFSSRCWEQLGYFDGDDHLNVGIDRLEAWRQRIHSDDLLVFDKTLNDHFMKKSQFDVEYRILASDDTWRWIRARGQMNYSEDGRPWRMSGTNMDITALKIAEENVMKAKEAAEKANQAKSDFLSSMSHELRTPLNAILGFAQLFDLDTNLTADQRDNVGEIRKAGEHLLGLVGEVLDLAKIEAGKMPFNTVSFDPVQIIKDCVSLLQTQADARGIVVSIDTRNITDQRIYADVRRFKQIVINLLSNAIKYNLENGSISIHCRIVDGRYCQVSVSDKGKGIPEKLHDGVFQPFNRLGAESSQVEGTGVGLAISKSLAEQMGGTMGFNSIERKGSTFWFQLPLEPDGIMAEPQVYVEDIIEPLDRSSNELELTFSGQRRILYIEDSLPNQRLMKQILARYPQLSLDVVAEGFSGIFEARTNFPDLIIMDINLPGMSGYETLEIMKRDTVTRSIPVVALSANTMEHDIERGKEAGFIHYLTKPLQLTELIRIFNEMLA